MTTENESVDVPPTIFKLELELMVEVPTEISIEPLFIDGVEPRKETPLETVTLPPVASEEAPACTFTEAPLCVPLSPVFKEIVPAFDDCKDDPDDKIKLPAVLSLIVFPTAISKVPESIPFAVRNDNSPLVVVAPIPLLNKTFPPVA